MRVILDTGPLVAYLARNEQHSAWCSTQMATLKPPLYTCEAVLSEAQFLLQAYPKGTDRLIALLRRSILNVSFSYAEHAERVNELMVKYADVPMSFADGCLVCMTEQTESTIFTLDSDFRIYRRRRNQPLQLVAPF